MHRTSAVLAILAAAALPEPVHAQGEIAGRVVAADSGRPGLLAAEASIAKLGRTTMSDSLGRFRLKDLPPGEHLIVLRAIGFRSESSFVTIARDEVVSWDVALTRTTGTVLPERVVTGSEARTPAKLVEFTEREKAGIGQFINRDQLARAEGGARQTGDLISTLPGVRVRRGSNRIWVASARAINTGKCVFCKGGVSQLDYELGARPACYLDVYIDALLVFDSAHPETGLFDVNSLQPEHIAGIEVYTSASRVPAKYNRTAGGCGVLLIWTR